MRDVLDKRCKENETHFKFSNFFPENRAVYEIMSKSVVEPKRPQIRIWRMRYACWVSKDTRASKRPHGRAPTHMHAPTRALTHTRARAHRWKYVIRIAFPW